MLIHIAYKNYTSNYIIYICFICIKAVSINSQSGIYRLGIRKQLSDRCHTHLEADVAKLAAI